MSKYDGAPSWAQDYLKGLDHMKRERETAELEDEYPGINKVFEGLIDMLPNPNGSDSSEFPFAAAVIRKSEDGRIEIISKSANVVNLNQDSTQHAEMTVLQEAQRVIGEKHLAGCALLSTAEPCVMCTGGIVNTNIDKVVYGIKQDDLRDKHARVDGDYKPHRAASEEFNTDLIFGEAGVEVYSGYMREAILKKMHRIHGSFSSYYNDPDA